MSKATVLSVDDDENLQLVVRHYLEEDGYRVVAAHSARELMEKLQTVTPDVVLLDLVLPDEGGLSMILKIREKMHVPIIIVSGKSDTTEKVIGLEMGADDYITKPFEMRELSARIKAAIRRATTPAVAEKPEQGKDATGCLYFDGWCLDRGQYQLFDCNSQSADLTTGEFRLLESLALAANRALSREQLFEITRSAHYDSFDRAIDIQIGRLRKKLNDDDRTMIKTVRGVGYMFTAKVSDKP